jgi:hypothetical protein
VVEHLPISARQEVSKDLLGEDLVSRLVSKMKHKASPSVALGFILISNPSVDKLLSEFQFLHCKLLSINNIGNKLGIFSCY